MDESGRESETKKIGWSGQGNSQKKSKTRNAGKGGRKYKGGAKVGRGGTNFREGGQINEEKPQEKQKKTKQDAPLEGCKEVLRQGEPKKKGEPKREMRGRKCTPS